jgi:ribosomal protein S18 acetylase RimI-like enzyme
MQAHVRGYNPRMDLPILKVTSAPTVETLVRYFHQLAANWTAHVAEKSDLEFGSAWVGASFPRVHYANRVMDVALPQGLGAQQALEMADAHFAQQGSACWQWIMNPSAPDDQTRPMIDLLLSRGYARGVEDIMYLEHLSSVAMAGGEGSLRIIPARASFRHSRTLHEQAASEWNEPQLVEAAMAHLDDPHYDALLALDAGQAIAHVGVLAMGEVGLIEEVFVAESHRGRGVGAIMIGRAMEACGRSLFKHVMLSVAPDNARANALYSRFGFRKIGQWVEYRKAN